MKEFLTRSAPKGRTVELGQWFVEGGKACKSQDILITQTSTLVATTEGSVELEHTLRYNGYPLLYRLGNIISFKYSSLTIRKVMWVMQYLEQRVELPSRELIDGEWIQVQIRF